MYRPDDHEHWRDAGRDLVTKALAELAYEEILRPQSGCR